SGYTFAGWYTNSSLTTDWNFNTNTVTSDITLYAKWQENITEHTVTFYLNYSGANSVRQNTVNGKVNYSPDRTGYEFNGWYTDIECTKLWDSNQIVTNNNLVLYAEWVEARIYQGQLSAPVVTINGYTFSWNSISNSAGYDIILSLSNTTIKTETTYSTSWTFPSSLEAGSYTFKIRAKGNGTTTVNSSYASKSFRHKILATATNLKFDLQTSLLTWNAVENATSYNVYNSNTLLTTTTANSYDMSSFDAGNYSIKIIATADGFNSSTATITVNKLTLKTPSISVYKNESDLSYTIRWSSINNADIYVVKLGERTAETSSTSYTITASSSLWAGLQTAKLSVAAKNSNADYLISTYSAPTTITKMYRVTVNLSDPSAGNIYINNSAVSSKVIDYGSSCTIRATVNYACVWLGWYKDNQKVTDELSYTFTMPSENITYTAKYNYYTVAVNKNMDEAGSVNYSTMTKVPVGGNVTLQATINTGYTWLGWYKGNQKVTDELSYTFTMSSENVTYTAKWEIWEELSIFNFTSTPTTCNITGIKDNTITEIILPNYVTSIGISAFSGCNNLRSITIPDSVTSIGLAALNGCSSLESVTIPFVGGSKKTTSNTYQYPFGYIFGESSYTGGVATTQYYHGNSTSSTTNSTFYIPSSLKSVKITGGDILRGAFYNCSLLTAINIPDTLTSIGSYAFYYCSSLESIEIPDSVTSIGSYAFYYCSSLESIEIPDSVTSIGSYAFYGCKSLTSVNYTGTIDEWASKISFGNGEANPLYYTEKLYINDELVTEANITTAKRIYSDAFYGCSSLTSVTIGNSVKSIGRGAFARCSSLTSINIPGSVTSIELSAFAGCNSLESVIIGNGVPYIGESEFSSCTSLKSITIPDSVTSIFENAFYGCTSLASITIPDSVTSIGERAFYGCTSLASITIPDSVTSIGSDAFYGCKSLTSIKIGNSVKSIGSGAFARCSSLTSITIPDSVTSIGGAAFSDCSSLTSVTIGYGVTSIGVCAFGFSSLKSVTFKNASWWKVSKSSDMSSPTTLTSSDLSNTSTAATYLTSTYVYRYWQRT
ncbi:MAG: leucine-rich repeat protein, partial [Clostridia bacterium]|nr:leucine-rich repeat protein [Clostridia bacterium]